MSAAAQYARYAYEARFEDLPADVVAMAKMLVLDSIGCALGATQTQEGKAYVTLAEQFQGNRESTVIGSATRIPTPDAAFVNSQLTNLLDFDDTYDVYRPGHPGCRVIPAALAVGERRRASGKDLLVAIALGYELSMRLGYSIGSILWTGGLTTLPGPLGAAVAAGKLSGLAETQIEQTFGILNLETGLDQRTPTRLKMDIGANTHFGSLKGNVGKDAELGIVVALKAGSGHSGIAGLLDLDLTGWYLLGLPVEGYDALTTGLGTEYRILDVSFKPTPSCRFAHAPITAASQALGDRPIDGDDVAKIVVHGVVRLARYECRGMIDAQVSTPYALALAIAGGRPGPAWYTSGRFRDADIRRLANKVELRASSDAEASELRGGRMTAEVEIVFRDGTRKTGRCDRVKGAPSNPMTGEELIAKFEVNASHLQHERRQALIDAIQNLERLDDVTNLTSLLATTP